MDTANNTANNAVTIKPEVVATIDGPRMSYLVVAIIDGKKVLTRHDYHTQANKRVNFLIRDYGCIECDPRTINS